jgi:sterol 14-demethylase
MLTAEIPGPRGLPVVGSLFPFLRDRQQFLAEAHARFGPVFRFRLGPERVVALIGKRFHAPFFAETGGALCADKAYASLKAIFGELGLTAPHELYLEQRPFYHAPLRAEMMRRYVTRMQRETEAWLAALPDAGIFELNQTIHELLLAIGMACFFGERFTRDVGPAFAASYGDFSRALSLAIPPRWPTPRNLRRMRAKRRFEALIRPLIAELREKPAEAEDFLANIFTARTRSGRAPTDDEIASLVPGYLFASQETTSGALAWQLIELLGHPEHRALVEAEVAEHLPPGAAVDSGVVRALRHLGCATLEIERLHPPADILMRRVEASVSLDGQALVPGELALISPALAHRLPEDFPDPARYDPSRFAAERGEKRLRATDLTGFGGGLHRCPGQNFATTVMIVVSALVLRDLDLTLEGPRPGIFYGAGAARPTPTTVRYRKRSRST